MWLAWETITMVAVESLDVVEEAGWAVLYVG